MLETGKHSAALRAARIRTEFSEVVTDRIDALGRR